MKSVIKKLLVLLAALSMFAIVGCKGFIKPQPGSIAPEFAVLTLDSLDKGPQVWEAEDLTLNFSVAQSGERFEIYGDIVFSQGLRNNFNRTKSFILVMSFVDNQNRVLQASDIKPLMPRNMPLPEKVKFRSVIEMPQGSVGIVFNYFGVFSGDDATMGDWDIYFSPYN